jgi:hypothetical protein
MSCSWHPACSITCELPNRLPGSATRMGADGHHLVASPNRATLSYERAGTCPDHMHSRCPLALLVDR